MTSLSKMLNILDMYGPESLVLDVDSIADKLELSRATAYRYVKELCDSGLLSRVDGSYTLGPRIIELDWMMRQYDPLISNGREIMSDLAKTTGLSVFISVLYDGRVINTHIESASQNDGFSFGRGRPLPLFKGAQSKVLVAHQKGRKLKRIFEDSIESNNMYEIDWKEFSAVCRSIRQDGFCITHDELNLGLTGIAAPIINQTNDEVLGSIAIVGQSSNFELLRREAVIEYVKGASSQITAKISLTQG
ncbi:MAG: IclR family transcriptional regulator [Neptuniibacter sp.]